MGEQEKNDAVDRAYEEFAKFRKSINNNVSRPIFYWQCVTVTIDTVIPFV